LLCRDSLSHKFQVISDSNEKCGMVSLNALWLPILLSAVIVFIASSIIHMVLPYHRSNYKKLPDEDNIRKILRAANLTPGLYHTPFCTHKEMNSPEAKAKFAEGPVALMTVFPSGPVNMGKFLGQWLAFLLVVGVFLAYLAGHTLAPDTPYRAVFRVVGAAAFLAYGVGILSNGIWKGQPWSVVAKEVFDGLIYSLLTAGVFGWLWPR
jgi:hypothetical protein